MKSVPSLLPGPCPAGWYSTISIVQKLFARVTSGHTPQWEAHEKDINVAAPMADIIQNNPGPEDCLPCDYILSGGPSIPTDLLCKVKRSRSFSFFQISSAECSAECFWLPLLLQLLCLWHEGIKWFSAKKGASTCCVACSESPSSGSFDTLLQIHQRTVRDPVHHPPPRPFKASF